MNAVENPLAIEVRKENLPEADVMALQQPFLPLFQEAQDLKLIAESIVVTSVDQEELIAKARAMRLKMKSIRTGAENVRKELKAESLRRGKAIDGMANVIKFLVVPIEEHLERQENFVALQQQQKIEEVKSKRIAELAPFGVDATLYADLGTMPEDLYQKLLQGAEASHKLKKEAEEKLRQEQEAKAKADAEERERVRLENEALKKKNEEERIAREKAEKELRDKREAEEKAKKEKEEQERAERMAPDCDKFMKLALTIEDTKLPEVETEEAKKLMKNVGMMLTKLAYYIRDNAKTL